MVELRSASPTPTVPTPRLPLSIRLAVASDLPFIDSLQKQHARQVGWMPTAQLEGKVRMGHVLIAEERHEGTEARRHGGTKGKRTNVILSAAKDLALRHGRPDPSEYLKMTTGLG